MYASWQSREGVQVRARFVDHGYRRKLQDWKGGIVGDRPALEVSEPFATRTAADKHSLQSLLRPPAAKATRSLCRTCEAGWKGLHLRPSWPRPAATRTLLRISLNTPSPLMLRPCQAQLAASPPSSRHPPAPAKQPACDPNSRAQPLQGLLPVPSGRSLQGRSVEVGRGRAESRRERKHGMQWQCQTCCMRSLLDTPAAPPKRLCLLT